MAAAFSVLATLASGAFALALFGRWSRARRTPALLTWGVSLSMFCIASAALAAGATIGWNEGSFRIFYLFGAVLNVPWLALGSVQVNSSDPTATRSAGIAALVVAALTALIAAAASPEAAGVFWIGAVLAATWGVALVTSGGDALRAISVLLIGLFSGLAVVVVWASGLTGPLPTEGLPEGRDLFGTLPRGLAFGGNTAGSMIVIVGAVASALSGAWPTAADRGHDRAQRQRTGTLVGAVAAFVEAVGVAWRDRHRHGGAFIAGNLQIALGVLIAGAGGAFSFLGETTANAVGLGLGVTVMYGGFVRTGSGALDLGTLDPEALP